MYSKYDFIEWLLGIGFFLYDNWWKIIIFGIIFVAGIIKIFEEIIMFELFDSYLGRMIGYPLLIIGAFIAIIIGIVYFIRR